MRRRLTSTEAELEMLAVQRAENRKTRGEWARFASHRKAVTNAILAQTSPSAQSLCLLGAGNCNDVDLEYLATRFEGIHLVDFDEKALLYAKNRVSPPARKKIRLHYRLDISGTIDRLPRWRRTKVSEREIVAHGEQHAESLAKLLGKFDFVVSTCMLWSLHMAVTQEIGTRHPLYDLVTHVTTKTHLRILEALTATNGSALLLTELTSSERVPEGLWSEVRAQFDTNLGQVRDYAYNGELQRLLSCLARGHHTLSPCNPRTITDVVTDDWHLNSMLHSVSPEQTWLWQQGPLRQALVYSVPLVRQSVVTLRNRPFVPANLAW